MNKKISSVWFRSLPKVVVFLVIPLTFVLVIVVLVSQSLHHRDMQQMAAERDLRAAIQSTRIIENGLFALQDELLLAARIRADGGDEQGYLPWLDNFRLGIFSFNCQQKSLSHLGNTKEPPGEPTTSLLCSLLENSEKSRAAYHLVTDMQPILWMAVGEDSREILIGGVEIDSFLNEILPVSGLSSSQSFLIFGQDHNLIYASGRDAVSDHDLYHPGVLAGLAGKTGTIYPDNHHGERIITYTPIQPVGWMLITEEAWQDVGNASLQTTQTIPLVLIPVLVIAILGLLILIRWVLQPLQRLANQTRQMDEMKLESLAEPIGGIEEITNLQASLISLYKRWMDARHNLQEYIGGLTASVEAERKELARELHDGLLQDMIAIKQGLQIKKANEEDTEKVQNLIDQVRGFVRGLRPPYLEDLGWVTAIRTLVIEYQSQLSIPVSLKVAGEEIRLSSDVELTLFRVVQEALTNIRKHAFAQRVDVSIQFLPAWVELNLKDDGNGFVLPDRIDILAAAGHYGLLGMKERIELAQGTLSISTAPGQGTTVLVRVPLQN